MGFMKSIIRNTLKTWIMIVLTTACALPALAMDNDQTRPTLKGIAGVHVVVEDLRLEIEEAGLTRDLIAKLAQDKLGSAGIKILSDEEWRETPGNPWLYIYAHVMRRELVKEKVFIFNIDIELKQKVLLVRIQDRQPVFATTWSKAILGKSGSLDDVRMGLELCLEDFIEAYRSANGL
jgi:hypothetical protein